MINFDGQGHEQYFGICISFYLIGSLVELGNDGFKLFSSRHPEQTVGKVKFICCHFWCRSHIGNVHSTGKQVSEVGKELLLFFSSQFAVLINPFDLCCRAIFEDGIQPFP